MTWSPTGLTLTPRKGWAGSAGPTTRDPVRGWGFEPQRRGSADIEIDPVAALAVLLQGIADLGIESRAGVDAAIGAPGDIVLAAAAAVTLTLPGPGDLALDGGGIAGLVGTTDLAVSGAGTTGVVGAATLSFADSIAALTAALPGVVPYVVEATAAVVFSPMSSTTTVFSTAGSGTWPIPPWCRYIDIVCIGGGASGQTGNGAIAQAGKGGLAGVWGGTTIERGVDIPWSQSSLSYTVGSGGAQPANSDHAASNPGSPTTVFDLGPNIGQVGGAGGVGTGSGQNGQSAATVTYQGITYTGGTGGTGNGGAGGAPGAGGAGGNGGIFGSRTRGGAGGVGRLYFQARQT